MFSKLSTQQLSDLLPFFRSRPHFALFANAVKFEVEQKLPNHPCDFYSLRSSNAEYFYCFRHDRLPDANRPILMIGSDDKVEDEGLTLGLNHIKSVEPDLGKISLLMAASDLVSPARKFLTTQCNLEERSNTSCYNFHVPFSAYPQFRTKVDEIALPSSFSIGSTRMSDAEVVNSTWKFATPEDILQQKEKIARLPTACIFHDGRPVSFEMIGLHGQLSHQYTFPEYRNRGFGAIVENSIVSNCISSEIRPIKSVELTNSSVLRRSLEHPLWEVVSDRNGNALVFDYVVFN